MKTNYLEAICSSERAYAAIPYSETGDNHQRFSEVVNSFGLAGYQNAAWCGTYQFAIELETVGLEQALRNWNMTKETYCGYSVSDTERAFARAGRTGSKPKVGALVIYNPSHMGRVLSVGAGTFESGEGNTSNKEFHRDGNCCAVKTYRFDDPKIRTFCYSDYEAKEMTANDIINSARNVYEMAHNGKYVYGDSHAMPPCSDGVISCDRLVARSLYNLSFVNQPRGGITVFNMEAYLLQWGFKKIPPNRALKAGDIVLMSQNGTSKPTAAWHTFIVTDVTVSGGLTTINKYDMGSQARINSPQPFVNVPVNQWADKSVYCYFRIADKPTEFVFTPADVKSGSTGASQYLANEILLAYDLKGIKKNGKLQSLELNNKWTNGDMAAMAAWKLDRLRNGDANLCRGPYGAGEIGASDWVSLLSSGLPFHAKQIPDAESKGASVLLWQRILRANGYKGADGKPLDLDAAYGENTAFATRSWQTANGMKATGKVGYDDWKLALRM